MHRDSTSGTSTTSGGSKGSSEWSYRFENIRGHTPVGTDKETIIKVNVRRLPEGVYLAKSPSGKWVHAAKAWTKRMMEPSRIIASETCGRVS